MSSLEEKVKQKKTILNKEIQLMEKHGGLDSRISDCRLIEKWFSLLIDDLRYLEIPQSFLDILDEKLELLPTYLEEVNGTLKVSDKLYEANNSAIYNILNAFYSYNIWRQLDFLKENVVIIGANGSGKSTLAQLINSTLPAKNGIVINAQKFLIIPTFNSIPSYNRVQTKLKEFQKKIFDDKRTFEISDADGYDYSASKEFQQGFNVLLSGLLGERIMKRNMYCTSVQQGKQPSKDEMLSSLDRVIEIWNDLIGDKQLFCDDSDNQLKIKPQDGDVYPAYRMSDGERVILYMLGRILQSPQNSYVIVDEPETYLHKAIVDKLWNYIERERQDCKFAYLTHDLSFALSRASRILWVKSFKYPGTWDIQMVEENVIPQALLLKLLGSKKKILFCEGNKKNSLDHQIFEVLFPQYTITPVQSCHDVINYVRAFNKLPGKNVEAVGIIDRDFRTQEQLGKLNGENIFSYNVAEIENLFLRSQFLEKYLEYHHENNVTQTIPAIKSKVLNLLQKNIDLQASMYVSAKIDYYFKTSNISQGKTLEEVKTYYEAYESNINIKEWYDKRMCELQAICDTKNYELAILVYNNKGLHACVEEQIGLRSQYYRNKALEFLKEASEDVKDLLREVFPNEIWKTL